MTTGKTGKPNMGRETQGRGRQTVTLGMCDIHLFFYCSFNDMPGDME